MNGNKSLQQASEILMKGFSGELMQLHPSIHLTNHPFVPIPFNPFILLSIHLYGYTSSNHPSIHQSIHTYITCSVVHLSINSSIRIPTLSLKLFSGTFPRHFQTLQTSHPVIINFPVTDCFCLLLSLLMWSLWNNLSMTNLLYNNANTPIDFSLAPR